jgi:hypothetical protein
MCLLRVIPGIRSLVLLVLVALASRFDMLLM